MKKGKKMKVFLIFSVLLVFLSQSIYASNNEGENYIWNEETNLKTYYDNHNIEEEELKRNIDSFMDLELENKNNEIQPLAEYRTFKYYDQKSKVTDYKAKYVGSVTVDNSDYPRESTILFTASNSGTWSVGTSINLSGTTEINAVVAKVNVTADIGGTVSRSWSNGRQYGTSSTVAPGDIAQLKAYMTGTYTSGDLVYDVYDSYGGITYEGRYPIGTVVPSKNDWNFVYSILN